MVELTLGKPLIPVLPGAGDMLHWEGQKEVQFRWALPEGFSGAGARSRTSDLPAVYELEIAKDPKFREIVQNKN